MSRQRKDTLLTICDFSVRNRTKLETMSVPLLARLFQLDYLSSSGYCTFPVHPLHSLLRRSAQTFANTIWDGSVFQRSEYGYLIPSVVARRPNFIIFMSGLHRRFTHSEVIWLLCYS